MKVALLSNINMNYVIRMLGKDMEIYHTEGYGNELGTLMNKSSSYYNFNPDITFFVMDLMEQIGHELDLSLAKDRIDGWFADLKECLDSEKIYYISDAVLIGQEVDVIESKTRFILCQMWNDQLCKLIDTHSNVRFFNYNQIIETLGRKNAFSFKTWYMGRILLSIEAQKQIVHKISEAIHLENNVAKKVLLLDLDNTLWGGLAGENDNKPIVLSDEHSGLIYKDAQRIIKQMQKQGTLLTIVSKNNEKDAMEIIDNHPHMILRSKDFVARRINWQAKHDSIKEIAKELNLGLDSFVFWDDNPAERELIKQMLPQVEVPDFPEKIEDIPAALVNIYRLFFKKAVITKEDYDKTNQYEANSKRNMLKQAAESFEEYLQKLKIVITRENPLKNKERIIQLVNKTNQFNLTTKRYTKQEMSDVLSDKTKKVFVYSVSDRFGDNGVVAVVIASKQINNKTAEIEEFVMSCRVMGRLIENAILEDVEQQLFNDGIKEVVGIYIPSEKNNPVKDLYINLGYDKTEDETRYLLNINKAIHRSYKAKIEKEY